MIDVTQEQLALVQKILHESVPGAKVWVFGSRAKGTTRRGSDLDLAVDNGAPLPTSITARLDEAFDEAPLPYRVDVVDMQSVSAAFKVIVERDRVPLAGFADGGVLS
jgi:predicted nucleotidyltransferase